MPGEKTLISQDARVSGPVLSADLPRPLPRLLVFRTARRLVYPVDAAIRLSPRFMYRSPQLRQYSGDGTLSFRHRFSQPWHGRPRTKRLLPQPRGAQ